MGFTTYVKIKKDVNIFVEGQKTYTAEVQGSTFRGDGREKQIPDLCL